MAKLLGFERNGHRLDRYWLHTGETGADAITVTTTEDIEPIIEANKAAFNDQPGRFEKRKEGLGKRIASIPGTIIEEICRIHKISFREFMLARSCRAQDIWNKFLNDPAFRHFRTAPGRVDMRKK